MMVRAALPQDLPVIRDLWNWMIRDTLATFTTQEKTVGDIRQIIEIRKGANFVAEESGMVLGFATFGGFRAGPGYASTVEHSLIVQPDRHRSGVGRALMQTVEDAARAQDKHVMVAAISGANPSAVAFHANLGFERVAEMREVGRKAGKWLDLVLMQKIL